jgi:hypothetical protein
MAQINLNKSSGANYELIFPVLPVTKDIHDTDILSLNIHGTVIPAISLGTEEGMWQGGQVPRAISALTYEPWYVNFTVDSNWSNWYLLYRWITLIDDGNTHYGASTTDYFADATLNIYDNANNRVMGIKIVNIYPTNLNEVTMSQRDGQENLDCGINFNYTRMEVERMIIDD